jgi:hypothetical protein
MVLRPAMDSIRKFKPQHGAAPGQFDMSKIFNIKPIAASHHPEQRISTEIEPPGVDFREVLRLIEDGSINRSGADRVVFGGRSEELMHQVAARYGFDRLPATRAELFGLFEYCDSLDAASGVGMRPKDQLVEWREASFVVWRRKKPELMPAIDLYCAENIDGLRALHQREDTLTALGRRFLNGEE